MKAINFGSTFYPTPRDLAFRMLQKVKGCPKLVLDPSAGKGDLLDTFNDYKRSTYNKLTGLHGIEINEDMQSILRGKGVTVIDSDFLNFSGPDKFDCIIMNPPFDNGDKHLLKAIDIMYRGQIVCLLNAETLRNPFSNQRKLLLSTLDKLGAEIEYIQGAFVDAERPTGVEVALIYIDIKRKVEDDLFSGAGDKQESFSETVKEKYEVSNGRKVEELVLEYNNVLRICTETILVYYRNHNKVHKYLGLNQAPEKSSYNSTDLTEMMQEAVNRTVGNIRTDFWRKTLNLNEVKKRLTSAKQSEFEKQLSARCYMDFTENNIRAFVLNIINGYEQTITESVLALFDRLTIESCYRDSLHEKNIHYFNGWKTNNAFKVGKKVIIPIYAGYGLPFHDYGRWKLDYNAAQVIADIDMVMNYFDGMAPYNSTCAAIEKAFDQDQNSRIKSTYFTVTCHKKGTIHMVFNDLDILRRFNVAACIGKGWLPEDYGAQSFKTLMLEQQAVAESFEGRKSYDNNLGQGLFSGGLDARLLLAA